MIDLESIKRNISSYSSDEIMRVLNSWLVFLDVPSKYRPDHKYSEKEEISLEEYREAIKYFEEEAKRRDDIKKKEVYYMGIGEVLKFIEGDYEIEDRCRNSSGRNIGVCVGGVIISYKYYENRRSYFTELYV